LWLIIALASLAILLLLVLSIPVGLALRLDVNGRPSFSVRMFWLFGLVSKKLETKEKFGPKKEKPKKKKKRNIRRIIAILTTRGLLKQIKILIRDVLKSTNIRQLRADFRVALDNPADTGLFFACLGPAFALFNRPGRCRIYIEPVFEEEALLEGYMQAVIRLLPIRLIFYLLKFIFSFPVLRAVRTTLSNKWKRRK
jgi:hypothetical protein